MSRADISNNEKKNYILSSKTINEIFWNYSIITQEKSQFDVLKNIIIPLFSELICTDNPEIFNSKIIFHFYESISKLFLEKHQTFLSNIKFTKKHQISFTQQTPQPIESQTIESLHTFIKRILHQNAHISNSLFSFSIQRSQTKSPNVIKLINENPTNFDLLFDSILWSIFKADLTVLLKVFEKIFLLRSTSLNLDKIDIQHNNEVFNNIKIIVDQDFEQSIIEIDPNLLENNIHYNKDQFVQTTPRPNFILAATPNFLLVYNSFQNDQQFPHFLKINLSAQNVSENNYFIKLQTKVKSNNDYFLTSVGNDALIYDRNGSLQLYNIECEEDKMISVRKSLFSHIPIPLVSDGYFVYSIMNMKEIGVYSLIKGKNSLSFVRKIVVNESTKLLKPYDDCVLSTKFLQGISIITNGIVLEIIFPEIVRDSSVVHFARAISLVTGNHIKDFRFELPFSIHSLSFDPLSRRIWSMSIKAYEVEFNQFKYNGPEPPWITNIEISLFSKFQRFSNFSSFVDFIIDYVHSVSSQFFGCEFQNNNSIPGFLVSSTNTENIDLVLSLLSQPPNNVKYAQILFILLSFQIKYTTLTKQQSDSIFELLKKYIPNAHLFNFFTLFIIQISPYIKSKDISNYFGLLFDFLPQNVEYDILLNLLLRLEKCKKFPYILDNTYSTLLQELSNKLYINNISEIGFNFMMRYQASFFLHFSRIFKYKIQKIQTIETVTFGYTSFIFCKVIIYLQSIDSIQSFQNSKLLTTVKKLLIELRLTADSSTFTWTLLPILQKLLKEFPKSKCFKKTVDNPLYLLFMDVFFLYVFSFKRMYSFSNIESIKNHFQFLINEIKDKEKSVSDILGENVSDDDFTNIINSIYTKVPNPINKRLTQEDKDFEKIFFLSLLYKTQSIQETLTINSQIKANQNVQIPPSIKQIAQTIYRIRSNLKSKRQNGDQADYLKLYQNYVEKTHFLLKLSSEKLDLKAISDFLNSDTKIYEIIQEKVKLESVKKNFDLFIPMANSFIIQDLPTDLIYLFIMNFSDNSDILYSYELVKKFIKIDLQSSGEIINNLLKKITEMPLNPILSFICHVLLMLTMSYQQEEIHQFLFASLINTISELCTKSKNIERIVFKSSISLLSHFNRILNEEKIFIIKQNEKEIFSKILNTLDLKYSMSFTMSHSLYQGLFIIPKSMNLINQMIGFVGQPKFHSFSLVLFDYLQFFSENEKENEFITFLSQILEIIGTVLSGSNSNNLLQIAQPIPDLANINSNKYIRTPTSQLACILDLIQIVRRLILIKGSNSSKMVFKHFKWISEHFQIDDTKYMKQLYAMLAVISNTIKVIRPYSIVKTNDNKTYFVLSLDEINQFVEGLLLPISKQKIIKHTFDFSSDLKSIEAIQYNLSLIKEFELPFSLFKKATHIDKKHFSDSLFKFYALQCVRENILDSEHGAEFSDIFFSKMKNKTVKQFMFSNHCPTILSLLKKLLANPSEGVFQTPHPIPQFYHTSFTQIVFNDDFKLTNNEFKSNKSVHVFISSVINNNSHPIYFCLKYEIINQNFEFGVICHSVDHNKKISITYSTQESKFFINGEKAIDHKLQLNSLIECRYIPSKNLISFADSVTNSMIFSIDLCKKYHCSFIILIYPQTSIKYFCDNKPQTSFFMNSSPTKKTNSQDQGTTTFSRSIQKNYNEEIEDIIKYSQEMKKLKYQNSDLVPHRSVSQGTQLFTYAKFKNLPETDLFIAKYPNAYFISLLNICSSPIQLKEYIQINDVSGRFNLVNSNMAIIENCNSIPAFNFQKYYNLPAEVLNCYIGEACDFYQQEILTLFTVHVLLKSKDVYSTMNQYFVKTSAIVNFITSILFLLEPINFSNLEEQKSPIDFTSFNGFETCSKTDLYDYFTAIKQIIDYFQENEKEKFIYKWFKKLKKDFQNKYMHFVTQKNNKLITVRSSIIGSFQNFDVEDVSGWIVFPFKFGFYKMPSISMNHLVFPKRQIDDVNYSYSASKILKIKATYPINQNTELITFGILPIFKKSNESLFYSFYHLAVSFKYFVLFSQNNISPQMNHQLWKLVINSITAGSPFFYTHLSQVLLFMQDKLRIDICPENISMLNGFSLSNSIIKQPKLQIFINRQAFQLKNQVSFIIEDCILKNKDPPINISLSDSFIPHFISKSSISIDMDHLSDIVSSILLSPNTKESPFPYHLIFAEWCESMFLYPPCTIQVITRNSICITFTEFVPESFNLESKDLRETERTIFSDSPDFISNRKIGTCKRIETRVDFRNKLRKVSPQFKNKFYIQFDNQSFQRNLSQMKIIVSSNSYYLKSMYHQFIYDFRNLLFNDIAQWNTFTPEEDQQILGMNDAETFTQTSIETRSIQTKMINLTISNRQPHLIYFRAIYLYTINFLLMNCQNILSSPNRNKLERFLATGVFAKRFIKDVLAKNGSSYTNLNINRQRGLDYRNGINRIDQNSMIAQFAREYIRNPSSFRHPNTPFKVHYENEQGIDVGGLMRDFFTELTYDINAPQVGLFIQTPNGRNHEGEFQDCIVPAPAPEISRSDDYYRAVGALLGIAIRTGMKQPDLIFSPFIWSFIITGKIEIKDIFAIDKSYMNVTLNLLSCAQSMSAEEFDQVMSSTVVTNIRGAPIQIDFPLSKNNCERFVAMCNEFRLNELNPPLTRMRTGFWENLNIEIPPFVTPSLLEFLVCGNRVITVDDLRRSTQFLGVSEQQKNFFWIVVARMSNDERKKMIHFATGLNSIGINGLKVDTLSGRVDALLPTASTCFFKLHLPSFSTADKMFNAFIIAINETGTFENG